MPNLKFPFARFTIKNPSKDPLGRASILRPVIPIRLIGPSGGIDTQALVDTGADDTIFDHELADAVGIPWAKGHSYNIAGINGSLMPVHFKGAAYEIGGHKFTVDIGFAAMPVFKAVLGQTGFFDQVFTTIDQGNNRLEIKF